MKCIEQEIHDYVHDLCREKEIPIEIRWCCFGDSSGFYKDGKMFTIACDEYYASNIEDIKCFMINYIEAIWEYEEAWKDINRSNYAVSIYVADIVNMDGWYKVTIGGAISGGNG